MVTRRSWYDRSHSRRCSSFSVQSFTAVYPGEHCCTASSPAATNASASRAASIGPPPVGIPGEHANFMTFLHLSRRGRLTTLLAAKGRGSTLQCRVARRYCPSWNQAVSGRPSAPARCSVAIRRPGWLAVPSGSSRWRRIADDNDLAQDALQESWAKILEAVHMYRGGAPACAWVCAIVAHSAADLRRKRRAGVPVSEGPAERSAWSIRAGRPRPWLRRSNCLT